MLSDRTAQRMRNLYYLTRLHWFPMGSLAIFWPYGWGVAMAATKEHAPIHSITQNTLLCLAVATLYHSAFCVWNDICDRDLDGKVERTSKRPLVTGAVSVPEALLLFVILLAITFFTVSFLGHTAFCIMVASLPINFAYPFAKRITWWAQFWLGLAASWGCGVGWASITGNLDGVLKAQAFPALCAAVIMFVIYGDTMYAAQDRSDDEKAGIKSTARLFGAHIHSINAIFGCGFVACLVLAGVLNGNGLPYFVIGCTGVTAQTLWQIRTWQPDDLKSCAAMFESWHNVGYILLLSLILDLWL